MIDDDELMDFEAPRMRMGADLEIAGVEQPGIRYAKKFGWEQIKVQKRGHPDRLFYRGPPAEVIVVEFKAKDKKARENQQRRLAEWEAKGFKTYLIDRKEQFDHVFRR